MHFRHNSQDRRTLASQHKREMYILHLALKGQANTKGQYNQEKKEASEK